jgi:hypothetical protein
MNNTAQNFFSYIPVLRFSFGRAGHDATGVRFIVLLRQVALLPALTARKNR